MINTKTYVFRYEILFTLRDLPISEAEQMICKYEGRLKAALDWILDVELSAEMRKGVPLPYGIEYTGDIFQVDYKIVVSKIVHTLEELLAMHQCLQGIGLLLKSSFDPKDLVSYDLHLCNE